MLCFQVTGNSWKFHCYIVLISNDTMAIKPILTILALVSSISLLSQTNAEYEAWIDSVADGNIAREFAYTDINGDTVRLSDFAGQYVFLDLWATWCGPCIAEIPALEKLKKKFKNDNIVFVSISMDKNKAAWEEYVTSNNLDDYQLFAGGPQSEPIWWFTIINGADFGMEGYGTGIPQFILIGPDGTIIDNTWIRPSEKECKWDLQDALDGKYEAY